MSFEKDGWNYRTDPPAGGDARKLVTLDQDGMIWVGIRAFSFKEQRWLNNNEPERAKVTAWRELEAPARGFWSSGQFCLPGAR